MRRAEASGSGARRRGSIGGPIRAWRSARRRISAQGPGGANGLRPTGLDAIFAAMDGAASRPPADGRSALVADLLLGFAVFLTRVAFLFDGYGTDPDAWRVAWAGRTIAATG